MSNGCSGVPIEQVSPDSFGRLDADIQFLLHSQKATIVPAGCPEDRCATCVRNTELGSSVANFLLHGEPIDESLLSMERALPELAGDMVQLSVALGVTIDALRTLTTTPRVARKIGDSIVSAVESINAVYSEDDLLFEPEYLLRLYEDTHRHAEVNVYMEGYTGRVHKNKVNRFIKGLFLSMDVGTIKSCIDQLEKEDEREIIRLFYFDPINGIKAKKVAKSVDQLNADRHGIPLSKAEKIRKSVAEKIGHTVSALTHASDGNFPQIPAETIEKVLSLSIATITSIMFRGSSYRRGVSVHKICVELGIETIGDFLGKSELFKQKVKSEEGFEAMTDTLVKALQDITEKSS